MKLLFSLLTAMIMIASSQMIHANPTLIEQHYAIAEDLFKHKKYAESWALFTDIINQSPNDGKAYLMRAQVLVFQGFLKDALADLSKALELSPELLGAVHHLRLRIGFQANDLNGCIKLAPKLGINYQSMADIAIKAKKELDDIAEGIRKGQYEESIAKCDAYLKEIDYFTIMHVLKTSAFIKLGEYEKAFESINKAISLHQTFAISYSLRAILYQSTMQLSKAQLDHEKEIDLEPTNEKFLKNKKSFDHYTDNFFEHSSFYHLQNINTLIKKERKNPSYYLYRSYIYRKNGQPKLESRDIRKAKKLAKEGFYSLLVKLGKEEFRKSFVDAARYFLQHAITENPQNKAAYLPYAKSLAFDYDLEGAISYLDRAISIDPDFKVAQQIKYQLNNISKPDSSDPIAQAIYPHGHVEQVINPKGSGRIFLILQYHNNSLEKNLSATSEEKSVPFVQRDIFNILGKLHQSADLGTILVEGVGNFTWEGEKYAKTIYDGLDLIRTHYPHLNQKQFEDYLLYLNFYRSSGAIFYESLYPSHFNIKGVADDKILARYFADAELANQEHHFAMSINQKRSILYLQDALKEAKKSNDVAIVIGLMHKEDIIQAYRGQQQLYIIQPHAVYVDPMTTAVNAQSQWSYLIQKGRYRELLDHTNEYIETHPDNTHGFYYKAVAQLNLYQIPEAMESAKMAYTLNPENNHLLLLLAEISLKMGNVAESRKYEARYARAQSGIGEPANKMLNLVQS